MRKKTTNLKNRNLNLIVSKMVYPVWGIFGLVCLSYLFFLGNTIFNVIGQKNYEGESLMVRSEIGQLELSYLNLSDSFNLSFAKSIGFSEPKSIYFTGRTSAVAVSNIVAQNVVR